jgi:surfactin synthase thioesterase subunit
VTPREAEAWAQYTTGTFELRVFEGAHFYLVRHMEQVNEVLRRVIFK